LFSTLIGLVETGLKSSRNYSAAGTYDYENWRARNWSARGLLCVLTLSSMWARTVVASIGVYAFTVARIIGWKLTLIDICKK
jgi:hypothetical protein